MNEAKAAVTAIKVVLATISAITVLLGVVNASVVAALNTLGVVGLASLVIGGGTWGPAAVRAAWTASAKLRGR